MTNGSGNSGGTNGHSTVESLLRNINNQNVGYSMSGQEIAQQNPAFSIAKSTIKSLEKVNGGIKVNLTLRGRALLAVMPGINISNGSVFTLQDVQMQDGSMSLYLSTDKAAFFGYPGIYIKANSYGFINVDNTDYSPIFKQ